MCNKCLDQSIIFWHPAKYDRVASWFERAKQATSIAQGLEQATAESVEGLETVLQLHNQSWDHRVVSKMHNDKFKEMELAGGGIGFERL